MHMTGTLALQRIVRPFSRVFITLLVAGSALTASAQLLTFTHFAGPGGGPGTADATGADASFNIPKGVAVDSAGNVYVADYWYSTIRKISSSGVVTTLAGLANSQGSADGVGSAARFRAPEGVAVDSSGNIYVADTLNFTVRKISPGGVVTTIAGLAGAFGNTDGAGTAARFSYPSAIAVDSSGNIYVAEQPYGRIRKITPAGVVSTFAAADYPGAIAVDSSGNVYVADNILVKKITPSGVVTIIAGSGAGYQDGTGSGAEFSDLEGIAVDANGVIYVSETEYNTIRKVTQAGVVTTLVGCHTCAGSFVFAGGGMADGPGSSARFSFPAGLAIDGSGTIYVAERGNNAVRKITPALLVTTLASASPGAADGTGATARFNYPQGIAFGGGLIYVADSDNHTIRKITSAGAVSTFAGQAGTSGNADGSATTARFNKPSAVAVDASGNVYVADTYNHVIRKISSSGVVSTLAGSAGVEGGSDGTGASARFSYPSGIAVDGAGTVYVSDTENYTIRKVTSAGVVTTLAGTAGESGFVNGTGAAARFFNPLGITVDPAGNVYVVDSANYSVRKITPAGAVTTMYANFGHFLWGLTIDPAGNLFVVDGQGNNSVFKITPSGTATTVAGTPGEDGCADGSGVNSFPTFAFPTSITTDGLGTFYLADTVNQCIRKGTATLADTATIDFATGVVGGARQLSSSPQTATAWSWSITRRPSGSLATLSSPTTSGPTFIPDKNDRFDFQLIATNTSGASVTTVSLTATCSSSVQTPTITSSDNPSITGESITLDAGAGYDAYSWSTGATTRMVTVAPTQTTTYRVVGYKFSTCPSSQASFSQTVQPATGNPPTNMLATATAATHVHLTWTAAPNEASYQIWKSSGNGAFVQVGTALGTSFDDTVSANATYLYLVRSVDSSSHVSQFGNMDFATSVIFTNDPIQAGINRVKVVHLQELRTATNAMRIAAGLASTAFSDPTVNNSLVVKANHVMEIRNSMNAARAALGVSILSFTNPSLSPGVSKMKAIDLQELRDAVK
jgi:sugar lactone lactonase YvrE